MKKKFTSIVSVLLSSVTAFSCLSLAGCGGQRTDTPHEHSYSEEWTKDATNHWKAATCEHTDEKKDIGAHVYDNDQDATCNTCNYTRHVHTYATEWTTDATKHWQVATCEHNTLKINEGDHAYTDEQDETCNTCDYTRQVHAHTYATEWTTNESKHWKVATCEHNTLKSEEGDHTYTDDKDASCNTCNYTRQVAVTKLSVKIYLVGDSTVCSFTDNYYMPRYGYGTQLFNYFELESNDQIVNLALSGRSSLSFLTEANYTTLTTNIQAGDYLIIGFGHNDEKKEDTVRYTNATKTHTDTSTENGVSFQYTLYQNYVKLAKDKGATPILCTPIVRYNADTAKYDADSGHVTANGNYAEAIKTLGTATDTTVIDLTALTKAEYIAKTTAALDYHAHTSYKEDGGAKLPDGADNTHLNLFGAKYVAYEFANAIKSSSCSLKNYVKANIAKPEKATDYAAAIKADFVKAAYTQFDPTAYEANYLGSVSGQNWYKTVMGDIGGGDKIANYSVTLADNKFTVGCEKGNGKFAGSSYGFGAAFIQLDAKKNFTASATVKVTKIVAGVANDQSGFGLMLRDDIYVDLSNNTIKSDCLMAGALYTKTPPTGSALCSYATVAGALKKTTYTANTVTVTEGATYTVSITKTANSFTATFSDGTNTYTETYPDFNVEAVDNDYIYLCLFANRGLVVEFSSVSVEITGDSAGA